MLSKVFKWLTGIVVSLLVLGLVIYIATNPQQPPADSSSARWLEPGPHAVGRAEFIFVDTSRATGENRGFPAKPERTFPTTIWYPENVDAAHPLIIHSHGILSSRTELTYLAARLASSGYVVVAADYPLTSGSTPGGANAADVANQPADVSFLIDSVLELSGDEKPFTGTIDMNRIGLTGLSLGGLTTTLATYHPRWREPRIKAAVSIAGPTAAFTDRFYTTTDIPFLMIAGTADALIDYKTNAAIIPERINNGALVTIDGGAHIGFVGLADPTFRFFNNADSFACGAVLSALDEDSDDIYANIGSISEGVDPDPSVPGVCENLPPPKAVHPGRQQMITEIAVLSFFESVFAEKESDRTAARDQLTVSLAADFSEVSFSN